MTEGGWGVLSLDSALAQQRSHFPNPVGVLAEKRGQESQGLIQKTVRLLGPARLKERQRGALSLADKWTNSIDCKVYWWGASRTQPQWLFFYLTLGV